MASSAIVAGCAAAPRPTTEAAVVVRTCRSILARQGSLADADLRLLGPAAFARIRERAFAGAGRLSTITAFVEACEAAVPERSRPDDPRPTGAGRSANPKGDG